MAARLKCKSNLIGLAAWLLLSGASGGSAFAQAVFLPESAGGASHELVEPVYMDADVYLDPVPTSGGYSDCVDCWTCQVLPDGLIYRSYLAGAKESRIGANLFHEKDLGWLLDVTLGGRVGLVRYGTADWNSPEGWQLDIEGAAFPRLDLERDWDMVATDFRFGVPLTYGVGRWQAKFAYYHLSSHLGDELAIHVPGTLASRINFSRDVLVLGGSFYPMPALRFYAETGWAFHTDDGTEPWEFQFGIDYSPLCEPDLFGSPFVAVNSHLREEVNFGGNLVVQAGWQWRGPSGHLLRTGLHYFNGKSNQYQFFNTSEEQIGLGLWYDY